MRIIDITLETLGLQKAFSIIHSGEFEKHPKPAPDIYLTVTKQLKVDPKNCLAVEDSPVGIQSAISAGMPCIAIIDKHHKNNPQYELTDISLDSLLDFTPKRLSSLLS